MLKYLGASLIILSSSMYGIKKSEQLRKRCENLALIKNALLLLQSEISYKSGDIKSVLASVGKNQNLPLFIIAAQNIESSLSEAFSHALGICDMSLVGTDKEIILELAKNLGSLDSSSQIKMISRTASELSARQESANADYAKYGKLYRSAGLLTGLLFSIILL